MYIGDGNMIHSPRAERSVEIIPLNTPGYIENTLVLVVTYLKIEGVLNEKVVRYSLVSTLLVSSFLVGCAKKNCNKAER